VKKINYVIKSIEIVSSIIPNITCFIRAAALKIIFNDIQNLRVIIGINVDEDNVFESHAWVTFNDRVILDNNPKINIYKVIYKI
jgi:hypothetical protein